MQEAAGNTERQGWQRRIVRWLVRRFYARVEIRGAEKIPQTGPVLLCANHANSLIDPVMVGIAARRPVRFMAKAPLFDAFVLGPTMYALGMIPAFRGSDDSKQVRKNLESLDTGAQVLLDGAAMGIFPEGRSEDGAQVGMVRSGAARMAVDAALKGATDLQVVVLGVNYEQKERFRSSVWIEVAEPINVTDWLAKHDGNKRKAMRALTPELESRLKAVVVHLDDLESEPILQDLEILVPAPAEAQQDDISGLRQRKRIADAMNHFLATDRPRADAMAEKIREFRRSIHQVGLSLQSPILQRGNISSSLTLAGRFLGMLLLFIPALLGTLHHFAPFLLVRTIASRIDQPGLKTKATHRLAVGLPIYALSYLGVAWWMLGYFNDWFVWIWFIAMPTCGVVALHYWHNTTRLTREIWHLASAMLHPKLSARLREQQTQLRGELHELVAEYATIAPRPTPVATQPKKRPYGRWAATALTCAVIAAACWIGGYWFSARSLSGSGLDLAHLPPAQLRTQLDADETALISVIHGLDQLEKDATAVQAEFAAGTRSHEIQGDSDAVRELLRRYIGYRDALFRILWKYQRHAEVTDERLSTRAFLIDYTAASVIYESALKFVHQFNRSAQTVAKLNEPEPNWSIPAGLYDSIRHNLANPANLHLLETARRYYRKIQPLFEKQNLKQPPPYQQFHASIARSLETMKIIDESLAEQMVVVAADDAVDLARQVQYATQSVISTWIGDVKIREPRAGKTLIDPGQLADLSKELKPGDILLERRNWYLSNAFLPGYWPHGALYVGTAEDLKRLGLDDNEYVAKHWKKFSHPDAQGHAHVIIEAVSEGVIFSSLEHSIGGGDSVAVLRPILTEDEIKAAIIRGFSFAGRPYDFEFDFSTTDKLVCTEVVFRSYGGNSGPIDFPVENIMGRPTMPAINLVRKFEEERHGPKPQLGFVAFIDGNESTGKSTVADEAAFVSTLDLPGLTWWSNIKKQPTRTLQRFTKFAIVLTLFFGACALIHKRGNAP